MKKLKYTEEHFEIDMIQFLSIINEQGIQMVFAPSRGGLIPAVRLSHLANIALGLLEGSRIDYKKETKILSSVPDNVKVIGIVDEILDTGETMINIIEAFKKLGNFKLVILPLITSSASKLNSKDANENLIIIDNRTVEEGTWVDFWWERPNQCIDCTEGEICNKYPNYIHCNLKNKSFPYNYGCFNFNQKVKI